MENKEKDWCREKDWGCGDDGTSDRRSSSSSWKKCLEISQKLGSIGMGLGPISRWSSMKGKAEQEKRRERGQRRLGRRSKLRRKAGKVDEGVSLPDKGRKGALWRRASQTV